MVGQYISLYDPSTLVNVGNQTGIVPNEYKLYSNYPNPFNPSTKIRFAIPTNGVAVVKIYNSLGKEVSTLVNRYHTAGEYEYNFDASNLSSGVYFYTLTAGNYRETKKMVLLK
ncbi:MAG: T9SS type A sorting domain-containing protein [Ignavibacteriae bacterium]|nr:T9SS type A sorting domain-containing protein [Ignavibacteriota bacterium]MCB9242852.1 T9SS type A sorting domain-containing protein [Ignavibacteriales bacterium]